VEIVDSWFLSNRVVLPEGDNSGFGVINLRNVNRLNIRSTTFANNTGAVNGGGSQTSARVCEGLQFC
jgi:hypothetical protein